MKLIFSQLAASSTDSSYVLQYENLVSANRYKPPVIFPQIFSILSCEICSFTASLLLLLFPVYRCQHISRQPLLTPGLLVIPQSLLNQNKWFPQGFWVME
jgi:hypothetical protein